jgi:hypothetical protein
MAGSEVQQALRNEAGNKVKEIKPIISNGDDE